MRLSRIERDLTIMLETGRYTEARTFLREAKASGMADLRDIVDVQLQLEDEYPDFRED